MIGMNELKCVECGEWHLVNEVELVNIEEDMQGRDVASFACPFNGVITKSLVYKTPYHMDSGYE